MDGWRWTRVTTGGHFFGQRAFFAVGDRGLGTTRMVQAVAAFDAALIAKEETVLKVDLTRRALSAEETSFLQPGVQLSNLA